jgi:hypothetical protein
MHSFLPSRWCSYVQIKQAQCHAKDAGFSGAALPANDDCPHLTGTIQACAEYLIKLG